MLSQLLKTIAWYKHGNLYRVWNLILLPITLLFFHSPATAEGSKDLVVYGGGRPSLEFYPNLKTAGIKRQAVINVFVKAGEQINLGSSVPESANGNADIVYHSPNGTQDGSCDVKRDTGEGFIETVAKESAGPLPHPGGYEPCKIIATETGIYEINFWPPFFGKFQGHGLKLKATNAFPTDISQNQTIAAWDITVFKTPDDVSTEQKGRAYANYLPMDLGSISNPINARMFFLSNIGFVYRMDLNGMRPCRFIFFANNKGFKDAPDASGEPIYKSVTIRDIKKKKAFVHNPASPDTTTDFTHKMFFNFPANDLPVNTQVNLPGSGTTWLRSQIVEEINVKDYKFVGEEGTLGQAGVSPLTGNFSFTIDMATDFMLTIDTNNNGIYGDGNDRVLMGSTSVGENIVNWDGLDGNGEPVPPQVIPYGSDLVILRDNIHFPLFDVENNPKGFILQRVENCNYTHPISCTVNDSTIFFNHSGLSGKSPPDPISALGGMDSSGGSQTFARNFGNNLGLDTWTSLIVPPRLRLSTELKKADLSVTKMHTTSKPLAGGPINYVITVRNDGPNDAAGIKVIDSLPATVSGPIWSCKVTDSVKPLPAIQNRCAISDAMDKAIDTTVDLQVGATATFILDGTIEAGVGDTVTNSVTITRPNDMTNPQGSIGDVKTETADDTFIVDGVSPVAVDKAASTDNETTVQLPPLEGSDADGTVVSYTVTNLPPESSGLVYLGDPAAGGTLVTDKQSLTPAQIGNLYFQPDAGFTGDTTFNYTATDNDTGVSNIATVTITVTAAPSQPPAADDITVPPTPNDTVARIPALSGNDPDGTVESYTITTLPTDGVLYLGDPADGGIPITPGQKLTPGEAANVFFKPNPGFVGDANFTYTATDNNGVESPPATVSMPVIAPNQPPQAEDKTVPPILNNTTQPLPPLSATDTDGTVESYTLKSLPPENQGILYLGDPADGGVPVTPGQKLTPAEAAKLFFKPKPDFTGEVKITYTSTDDQGDESSPATVTIPVEQAPNKPPVLNNDSATTDIETPVTIDILGNDNDPDGNLDPSTVKITNPPPNGTVTVNPDGSVTYTPNPGFTIGTDTFTYEVCDTGTPQQCHTAEVSVLVPTPANEPPVANNQTLSPTPNNTTVPIPSLAANDPDGTVASYKIEKLPTEDMGELYLGDPAKGGTKITAGQELTPEQIEQLFFKPNPTYVGDASFSFSSTDNQGSTGNIAQVTIPVTAAPNKPPVANDDSTNAESNTPVTLPVLNNDSDPDDNIDPTSVTIVSSPSKGDVTVDAFGSITYTPNPDFTTGTDTLVYQVCDSGMPPLCDTATVEITMPQSPNPPPVANSITTPTIFNNTTVSIPPLSATDDGTIISYTIDTLPSPEQGVLYLGDPDAGGVPITPGQTLSPDDIAKLVFKPDPDFTGNASFTYTTTDNLGAESSPALVTIPVVAPPNHPPVASDKNTSTDINTPVTIPVLNNDSDPDGNIDVGSLEIFSPPENGTVTINDDGTITYTPNPNFTAGTDTFTYQICDNGDPELCDTATVTVVVPIPVNPPPVADNKVAPSTLNNTTVQLPPLSATDQDGTVVSMNINTLPPTEQGILYLGDPAAGGVPVTAGQKLSPTDVANLFFKPEPSFVGDASFTYTATDNLGAKSDPALLTIPVTAPPNAPPTANDDSAETDTNTPVTIPILNNDSDPDGNLDPDSVTILAQPTKGRVNINPDNTVTYTPDADATGMDIFTYKVCDKGIPAQCDKATVTIKLPITEEGPTEEEPTKEEPSSVNLNIAITGNGKVSSVKGDCDHESDPCDQGYETGTEVNLIPKPDSGWEFEGWRGHCNGEGNVTMDSDKACRAVFIETSAPEFNLSVARSGPGTVASQPTGIDCGVDCAEEYASGSEIELTATPEPGSVFTEWTGDCSGTNPTTTVTMNAAKRCQANFAADGDNDKIANGVEDTCHNDGDANRDGILDSLQSNVASWPAASGECVTVVTNNDCPINNVKLSDPNWPLSGGASERPPLEMELLCEQTNVTTYYNGQATDTFALNDGGSDDSGVAGDGKINYSIQSTSSDRIQWVSTSYSADEFGNATTVSAQRIGNCQGRVSVNYTTQNGTALQYTDYLPKQGTLVWEDGDCSTKSFQIPIQDDSISEGDETVNLKLSNPTGGATIVTPDALLTIVDNEAVSPTTTTNSCYSLPTCQVCCPNCQPYQQGSDLKIKSLTTTIKVGETENIILADGKGELLIKEIPNNTFVSLDSWKPLNVGAGEVTLTGLKVGETKMVISDSAVPLQTVTIYITVIDGSTLGIGQNSNFRIKAIQTTIEVGQTLDLTVAGGQGELTLSEIPDPTYVLLNDWTPLGDTGTAQFTLTGVSVGKTKIVVNDDSTPPQKTTVTITVVRSGSNSATNLATNPSLPDGTRCEVNAVGIDGENNSLDTQACFASKLSIREERLPNHRRLTHKEAQTIRVSSPVVIEPAHIGQAADILMVGIHSSLTNRILYTRDEQTWKVWDENISSLPSAQYYPQLPEKIEIFVYEGNLSPWPGEYAAYVGYRLEDGTIIYNGAEPIHFWVGNSTSFDMRVDSRKTPTLNEVHSTSIFEPLIHNFEGQTGNHSTFEYFDQMNVSTFVNVEPQHVGQPADILMVAQQKRSLDYGRIDYTRFGPNWQRWDNQIGQIPPASRYQQLPEKFEIPIYLGPLAHVPGEFTVYIGYRLENGIIVFNGVTPILLTIANGFGFDAESKSLFPTTSRFISIVHDGKKFGNPFNQVVNTPVAIATSILVEPQHIGENVDILMYALRYELGERDAESERPLWGMWDKRRIILESLITNVTLAPIMHYNPLFEGRFKNDRSGYYLFYVGYRLKNGDVIYNGGETLRLGIM